ncbi:hypothetical protein NLJ89_g2345 [Agrocybe chaxingu]|uniref:Aminotransferase class V domain-containing protein n=1 Tax=Agrocybe chaxingu TaxID=84603 RepID=A0A9W8K621_9AGAR|nr:hypothetical protein NLJ89_g2345 [Agrocybe chaxingu]
MGNSHSHSCISAPGATKPRPFSRKRSAILTRIHLSCADSSDSLEPPQDTSKLVSDEKSVYVEHHRTTPPITSVAYCPIATDLESDGEAAFECFLREYPEYRLTWILDTLRRTDFARLERAGETYVDYMGGSLYPESLIRVHTDFLNHSILGNTHSVSNRASSEYTVVFTANASAALKLVAEAYPFTGGSSLVIGADSHNSVRNLTSFHVTQLIVSAGQVHGIREFATYRSARTVYVPSTAHGGFDIPTAKDVLQRHRPRSRDLAPSLFVLTAQSNISNSKNPLSITHHAASLGYHTVVDGAALAPTSVVSLADYPIDAMAVSFYKMFGYPTGVGALIVKRAFLSQLKRPWFAGGTVDVVQVPGNIVTRARLPHEQFEDGTINYLQLPAITDGLRFLSAYLPFLPLRLSSLLLYLTSALSKLRHDTTGRPVVQILSKVPTRRLRSVGEQAETGSIVSLLFLSPTGEMIPNSFIEHAASSKNISLRTGCMCNPGGAAAILGIEDEMGRLYPGVTLADFQDHMGRELGVVRISLGLASNFQDVWRVVKFASSIGQEYSRQILWNQWMESQRSTIGQAL